jgi:predicted nucleic acid-binding protein
MSKKASYAWDTSVLIAWLCQEAGAPLGDIDLVVDEIDREKSNLILSATTFSEILETKYNPDQLDQLNKFLQRSNVINVDMSFKIAKKASAIRAAALQDGRKITSPDAQIIAIAIEFGADVLHTLDDKLLALSGSRIVDGLKITHPKPLSGQTALPFGP